MSSANSNSIIHISNLDSSQFCPFCNDSSMSSKNRAKEQVNLFANCLKPTAISKKSEKLSTPLRTQDLTVAYINLNIASILPSNPNLNNLYHSAFLSTESTACFVDQQTRTVISRSCSNCA